MSTIIHDAATLRLWITKLDKAMSSGVRMAVIGGTTVTYATVGDMMRARNDFLSQLTQLEQQAGGKKASRQSYACYAGRGY